MTDHLGAGLEADADIYDIPPGDLSRVKTRARRRDQRRRRFTGSVAVLAVVAGTFTAVRLADNEPKLGVATEGAAVLGDSGIAWAKVEDPDAALGGVWRMAAVDTGDGVYALSTAPGQQMTERPAQRVIWRSDDGVEWAPVATPDSFWMTDLSASDGRLYAIGTGPATRSASGRDIHDVRVGWSEAGSDDWAQESLPLDLRPMTERSTSVRIDGMDVAAGPNGIVAAVSVRAEPDVRRLLGVDAPNGWTITAEGVNVLGDGECPTNDSRDGSPATIGSGEPATSTPERPGRRYAASCDDREVRSAEEVHGVASSHPWSELDLPADVLDAFLGRPFVFHSADGGASFERVELPVAPQDMGVATYVERVADGFTLVTSHQTGMGRPSQVDVLRSLDGRTWERQSGAIPGLEFFTAIGAVDGRLAIVGQAALSAVYAELHPDGWRVTSLADVLGIEVDDERGLYAGSAAIGPLGVVIAVTVPGEQFDHRLLASRDGQVWSSDSLAELTGRDDLHGVSQIVVRGDRVAVSVRVGAPEQGVTGRVAVVGTPR